MLAIRAAWRAAAERLEAVSSSAKLDAQVLLTDVLGADNRAYLLTYPEKPLTEAQGAEYERAIARRATGEPVAYIRGYKDWYDRRILVTPDVLIPRPETELLLEAALERVGEQPGAAVADICTGSGAIAVTLAAHAPQATVYATDLSAAALEVARRNAQAAAVSVDFRQGDLLAPLMGDGVRLDVLVSNPPYIATDELQRLAVARHEPSLALDGGADGLDLVRDLLSAAPVVLRPGALVLVEIGAEQGEAVLGLAQQYLQPQEVRIVPDYAGLDRFLWARLPG